MLNTTTMVKVSRPPAHVFLRTEFSDRCWNWTGSKNIKGYGHTTLRGRHTLAHRVAYEAVYGEFPKDNMVLHLCDNPSCVNPRHLYLGNAKQNARDHWERCRPNKQIKMSPEKVRITRQRHLKGDRLYDIAADMGVSYETIWLIIRGRTWAHVV